MPYLIKRFGNIQKHTSYFKRRVTIKSIIYLVSDRYKLVQYLAFNDRITSWFIDYVTGVVFVSKKMRSMPVSPGASGCAVKSSTMNATLGSEQGIFDPQVFYAICEDLCIYPAFWLCFDWHGKDLMFFWSISHFCFFQWQLRVVFHL